MDMVSRLGLTKPDMKVLISVEANMVKDSFPGTTELATPAISSSTTSQVMVCIHGQMVATTMAYGKLTRCMALESSDGMTDAYTKDILSTIKKKDMANSNGATAASTKVSGRMENKMAWVSSQAPMVLSRREIGLKVGSNSG